MKRFIIISLFFVPMLSEAQSSYFYINWDYNMPLSNTEWLGNSASRGGKVGYRGFINDRMSIGLDLGWTTFTEYSLRETFQNATGAITTDYFKYIYSYSAVASAQYYFPLGEGERVFPYAGLGLGANRNEYALYYNIYEDSDDALGFLARPEAGILVRFNPRRTLGAIAAVHYDYSTNKMDKYGYSNFSSLGFQLGIILMGR
jgi:hypothetical protein